MPKTFIISDQSVNNYGFIMLTSGIDLSQFKKNPVMLFNHCENDIPGKWDNIRVEGNQLLADAVFDEKDPEAMVLSGKVDGGFLNGTSIGFDIVEFELGMPGFEGIPICTKSILKECSLTPIPSNGNALRLFDKEGKLMSDKDVLTVLSSNKLNPKIEIMKDLKTFIVALGLAADATEEQVLGAVKALKGEHTSLTSKKSELEQKLAELQTKVDEAKTANITQLVDGAVTSGKIIAAEKDTYVKLATADFESTKSILDAKKAHTTLTAKLDVSGKEIPADPRAAWTFEDWSKKDSKALLTMKREKPEQYKALYDGFYKTA